MSRRAAVVGALVVAVAVGGVAGGCGVRPQAEPVPLTEAPSTPVATPTITQRPGPTEPPPEPTPTTSPPPTPDTPTPPTLTPAATGA